LFGIIARTCFPGLPGQATGAQEQEHSYNYKSYRELLYHSFIPFVKSLIDSAQFQIICLSLKISNRQSSKLPVFFKQIFLCISNHYVRKLPMDEEKFSFGVSV